MCVNNWTKSTVPWGIASRTGGLGTRCFRWRRVPGFGSLWGSFPGLPGGGSRGWFWGGPGLLPRSLFRSFAVPLCYDLDIESSRFAHFLWAAVISFGRVGSFVSG